MRPLADVDPIRVARPGVCLPGAGRRGSVGRELQVTEVATPRAGLDQGGIDDVVVVDDADVRALARFDELARSPVTTRTGTEEQRGCEQHERGDEGGLAHAATSVPLRAQLRHFGQARQLRVGPAPSSSAVPPSSHRTPGRTACVLSGVRSCSSSRTREALRRSSATPKAGPGRVEIRDHKNPPDTARSLNRLPGRERRRSHLGANNGAVLRN